MFTTDGQYVPAVEPRFNQISGEEQIMLTAFYALEDAIGIPTKRELHQRKRDAPVHYIKALEDISRITNKYPRSSFDCAMGHGQGRQKVRAA